MEESMLNIMQDMLNVISEKYMSWTDCQIGKFVKRRVLENISQEDLVKEIEEEG